jgi:shikimate kinase
MAGRHLALVGMMGAGKSTVGAECARRLECPFVDVDDLVEATTGRTVADIFRTDGEAAFRSFERVALADAVASPAPLVIAAGGGAVLDTGNRRLLRQGCTVVWLRAGPDELARRVAPHPKPGDQETGRPERPLLADGNPRETLERLTSLRTPTYEAVADAVVDTEGRSVAQVTDAVLEELARCAA